MTVADLKEKMTFEELLMWGDWFSYKAEVQRKQHEDATRNSGSSRPSPRRSPRPRGHR